MLKKLEDLKKYTDIFSRGLLRELAPDLAGGLFLQLFDLWRVDKDKIAMYVDNDVSLWSRLPPQHQARVHAVAHKLGKLDWITADWVINVIRYKYTLVASMFMGCPEAYSWLERQVEEIKRKASE